MSTDNEQWGEEVEGAAIQRSRVPTPTERIAAVEREISDLRDALAAMNRTIRTHWHPDSP